MAVVLKTGTKPLHYTRSVVTSVITDGAGGDSLICDQCNLQSIIVEASGFCLFCKKYMCSMCQHKHQTAPSTKSHIFLLGAEMPRERNTRITKKTVTHCEKHGIKMAEFYCPKHIEVFCFECKETYHGKCQNIGFVKSVAKGTKGGRELPRVIQDIRKMVTQLEKMKHQKQAQHERTEEQQKICLKNVTDMRKQVDEILDEHEKKIRKSIENRFSKEIRDINDIKSKCEARLSILEEESKNLEILKSADDSQCFISMLKAKQSYTECENALGSICKEKREITLTFEPNHKLMHLVKDLEAFGNIKASVVRPKSSTGSIFTPAQTPSLDLPSNMMSTLKNGKEFVLCGEHNITSPADDKSSSSVTGSTFLPDGRLLICDGKNHSVKLFDQTIKLKSTHKLPAAPCDVTSLTNREGILTVPDKKELHFVIMDPDLRTTRIVNTEISCHGIRSHKDGLLVTCYSHGVFGMVQLLDLEGRVKQRYERDLEGNSMFHGPYFIAVSPKRDRFYVSDKATNSVLGLTMGGKIIFSYRSKQLEGPGYIAVDKEGSIYVCGRDSKNVHVIKPDGRKIKIFLSEDGLEASSICYRASDGLFVVSTNNTDIVRTYKLL